MTDREAQLREILSVGHETSMRGAGISLRDALLHCQYRELRPSIGPRDLLPIIQTDAELVKEWLWYSYDKRTGGWWIQENGDIGRTGASTLHFESIEEAVANYVVHELDYWAGIRSREPH